MKCIKKILVIGLCCLCCVFAFCGCNSKSDTSSGSTETVEGALNPDEMFSDKDKEIGYDESTCIKITLADNASKADSDNVTIDGNTVTIKKEGTYLVSGTLSDGQLTVSADDAEKVHIILNGVSVTNDTSASLYIKNADKVFVTTVEKTENSFSTTGEFTAIDDNNIDAAIFSKADLTLNGAGSLKVNCAKGHGVVSKDDLVVACGSYDITAASHGLYGKNSVRIADGSITINSGKDGVQSENTDDETLGYIFIANGTIKVTAGQDGFDAQTILQVEDGDITVAAGGGSANAAVKKSEFPNQTQTYDDSDAASAKSLKAGSLLIVKNGTFTLDSVEDTLHSNGNLTLCSGAFNLTAGDDGIHSDTNVKISDGTVNITKSYEGIEGQTITIDGGKIDIVSSDDGLNAAGGNDSSGTAGNGKDQFASDDNCNITINDGTLTVSADGDGIDSNGNITIAKGTVTVWGPTNDGNGTLDYGGTATISNGTFLAAGSSGMAQGFSDDSSQGSILYALGSSVSAGTEVSLQDSEGNVILTFTPQKTFSSVQFSSAKITKGSSYKITVGDASYDVTMDGISYSNSSGMGGGQGRGGGGMDGGTPPDGGNMPQGNGGNPGQRGDAAQ